MQTFIYRIWLLFSCYYWNQIIETKLNIQDAFKFELLNEIFALLLRVDGFVCLIEGLNVKFFSNFEKSQLKCLNSAMPL